MRLVFLLASVTAVMAAGADNNDGYANSFSYGNGQGFGYSGSFGGSGDSPPQSFSSGGSPPQSFGSGGALPPNFPPFDFSSLFNQYFNFFQKFNQDLAAANAYSITNAFPNSRVQASSSITYNRKGLQNQQNAIISGAHGVSSGYPPQGGGGISGDGISGGGISGGGFGGGFSSFGGQGAAASASLGPGGGHQTAAVFPENPKNPNVNNRFGSSSPGGSSYGIFTSSQSFSSNQNGKPTNYHQATTTINDNGKVTSYTVHNP